MSEPTNEHRPLSEISHLFLSSVRDKATNGAQRPKRTPPPKNVSLDLTPEEFAQVFGAGEDDDEIPADKRGEGPVSPVTVIIAQHLNGRQCDRISEYARHLASDGTRIGMIEVTASEFRVVCFDKFADASAGDAEPVSTEAVAECFDPRQMTEVLAELSWDVQRWLLVLPQPRVPEARVLLRGVKHWAMLSTCDHDGVIAAYRSLKGLIDLWPEGKTDDKPNLSLALLDPADQEQADRVGGKLVSVCQQFLSWPLELEPHVRNLGGSRVNEHVVMSCRPIHDKSQLATAPQWQIVADFLARARTAEAPVAAVAAAKAQATDVTHQRAIVEEKQVVMTPEIVQPVAGRIEPSDANDVIDLPADIGEDSIVEAILKHCSGELVACPIAPPMCPRARLAVSRDRRVVMLAVARQGLSDLSMIGSAYRWLKENQNLIGMAVPQLAIDPKQSPHLSLLVNQSDSTAQTLQPMLQGEHVTVKTYRKLRWGGKTGLLLEAA